MCVQVCVCERERERERECVRVCMCVSAMCPHAAYNHKVHGMENEINGSDVTPEVLQLPEDTQDRK